MTLSLDAIQAKRFRVARKNGYEVSEVDEFVDEVEETVAQLISQNDNLKKQVEALQQPGQAPAAAGGPSVTSSQRLSPPGGIVVSTTKEASAAVVRLVELSTEQAERLVAEAGEEADRIREDANRLAEQVTSEAKAQAERLESEARQNAERLESEAAARAEASDREVEERRTTLFGELEDERQRLADEIEDLRRFEATFRKNLLAQLHAHIEQLESGRAEPSPASSLAGPAADDYGFDDETDSNSTPRMNALIRDPE
jgi:DivIVA domain-containing protein